MKISLFPMVFSRASAEVFSSTPRLQGEGSLVEDVNNDGNLDVLAIQNDFSFEPLGGLYDAGIGLVLLGDGKGMFKNIDPSESKFCVKGDSKSIVRIETFKGEGLYVISRNQDSVKVLQRIINTKFN